jgi:hypothetical protein
MRDVVSDRMAAAELSDEERYAIATLPDTSGGIAALRVLAAVAVQISAETLSAPRMDADDVFRDMRCKVGQIAGLHGLEHLCRFCREGLNKEQEGHRP